jgi:hypothetical protein
MLGRSSAGILTIGRRSENGELRMTIRAQLKWTRIAANLAKRWAGKQLAVKLVYNRERQC